MSDFVLDASVALALIFEDESSAYSDSVADSLGGRHALVPIVWPLEIANSMLTAVRRGSIPGADLPRLTWAMNRLRVEIDQGIAPEYIAQAAMNLGMAHGLSA